MMPSAPPPSAHSQQLLEPPGIGSIGLGKTASGHRGPLVAGALSTRERLGYKSSLEVVPLGRVGLDAGSIVAQGGPVQSLVPPKERIPIIGAGRGWAQSRQRRVNPGWLEDAGAGRGRAGEKVGGPFRVQVRYHGTGRLADSYGPKARMHADRGAGQPLVRTPGPAAMIAVIPQNCHDEAGRECPLV